MMGRVPITFWQSQLCPNHFLKSLLMAGMYLIHLTERASPIVEHFHLVSVLKWEIFTVVSCTKRQWQILSHIQFLDMLKFITFPQLPIHSGEITKQYVNKYVPKQILINIHWRTSTIWNPKPLVFKAKTLLPDPSAILDSHLLIHVFIICPMNSQV